jgi:Peptidase inhibitor I78 family
MSNHLRYPARTMVAFALSFGLNACTAAPTPEPSASVFPALPPPPITEPAATCDQSKGSWAVGKPADEALLAKILSDTGAKHTRVLRPGMMVTAEFDGTRINIRVDNNNLVLAVTCG